MCMYQSRGLACNFAKCLNQFVNVCLRIPEAHTNPDDSRQRYPGKQTQKQSLKLFKQAGDMQDMFDKQMGTVTTVSSRRSRLARPVLWPPCWA